MKIRRLILVFALWQAVFAQTAERPKPSPSIDVTLQPGQPVPTGMSVTPAAAPRSQFQRLGFNTGQPVTTAISPDGNTLLVLTSGYNAIDYVFVYDVSNTTPILKQSLPIALTFMGLAWNPSGKEFYVSGGSQDVVYAYSLTGTGFVRVAQISLGHGGMGLGLSTSAVAAGMAVNANGDTLIVANYLNDSITLINLASRQVTGEVDLRPGIVNPLQQTGIPGGEYPFWVAMKGNDKAYVSSVRDREIVVVSLSGAPAVVNRIAVPGQPNKMIVNQAQTMLFAALDNSDSVAIVSTDSDTVLAKVATTAVAPDGDQSSNYLKGSNPNSLALSPDEGTLYVTNGGTNTVAVISLSMPFDTDGSGSRVRGLIPTGWYPESVSVSRDGSMLYVVNSKDVPGPNAEDEYVLTQQRGGLLTIPVPDGATLDNLTRQAEANNNFALSADHWTNAAIMAQVRDKVKHVIYIVKENRTYDQVLGDLPQGNGDPALTLFPEAITPNQHRLARLFVTMDNFYDSGEVSGVGWSWSTAARATDSIEKVVPVSYANHLGSFYDYEGGNRGINVGIPDLQSRIAVNPRNPADPNLLPGAMDVNGPDSSEGDIGGGYLWDSALRMGLSVRNYGCYLDLTLDVPAPAAPYSAGVVQAHATKQSLMNVTDPYFRGFDNNYPDFFRYQEWAREFDAFVVNGNLPQLSLVRLMHDHTGSFTSALFGVNTVDTQLADNDYAVGLLVEKVANSRYKDDTLVFVIEDDAQDGADHVDAHRSIAFVAGPYVKQGALITDRYTTVSMIRTIKDVLGIPWMGLYDGTAEPMAAIFDLGQPQWTFQSTVPEVLRTTQLPLPGRTTVNSLPSTAANRAYSKPRHNAKYWGKVMEGQNFDKEDDLDEVDYNHALWIGLKGKRVPYPNVRDGRDLRENRGALLK